MRRTLLLPSSEIIGDNETYHRNRDDVTFVARKKPVRQQFGARDDDIDQSQSDLLDQKFKLLNAVEATTPDGRLREEIDSNRPTTEPAVEMIGNEEQLDRRLRTASLDEHNYQIPSSRVKTFSDRLNYVYTCLDDANTRGESAGVVRAPKEEVAYAVQSVKMGNKTTREIDIMKEAISTDELGHNIRKSLSAEEDIVIAEDTLISSGKGGVLADLINPNNGDYIDIRRFEHRVNYVYNILKSVETQTHKEHNKNSQDSMGPLNEDDGYDIASNTAARKRRIGSKL